MQIKQWNKKGVADITDPKFWGIVGAMWIIILIMVWKMSKKEFLNSWPFANFARNEKRNLKRIIIKMIFGRSGKV